MVLSSYSLRICLVGLKKTTEKNGSVRTVLHIIRHTNCTFMTSDSFQIAKCLQTSWLSLISDNTSLVKGNILHFFYSSRKGRFMNTDVLSSYVKCYICPFLNVFDVGRQIMVEISKIKFHENLSPASRVIYCGETEGRSVHCTRFDQFFILEHLLVWLVFLPY